MKEVMVVSEKREVIIWSIAPMSRIQGGIELDAERQWKVPKRLVDCELPALTW